MKSLRVSQLLAAAAATTLAAQLHAQLVFDPFDYPAGNLDGRVNPGNDKPWSVMGSGGDEITVTSPSLSYAGLAPVSGNAASWGSTGNSQRLALGPSLTSGTTYYSLTLQVNSIAAMTTSPTFIAGFSPTSGTSGVQPTTVGTRLYLRQSAPAASTFNIGVSKNSSTSTDIAWGTQAYALGTPIFVVGSYTINGTTLGTDDEARLYINPTDLGAAAAPTTSTPQAPVLTAPVTGSDLFEATPALAGFVLRQGTQVPDVTVDELRIDRTWAQVTPPIGVRWTSDGDGNWSDGFNWSTMTSPNDAAAFVTFGEVISFPRAVEIDTPVTLRTINFNSTATYTLNGIQPIDFSPSAAINVHKGSHTIIAPINLSGDLLLSVRSNSTLLLSDDVVTNGNSITKAGAGSVEMTYVRGSALNIWGGRVAIFRDGSHAATSKISSLDITPGSALDLANNSLILDYTGDSPVGSWNGSAYTGITGLLQAGRNGGFWDGVGIITSMTEAAGDTLTTLAVSEASRSLGLDPGETALWRGQIVDDTSILIKYTWGGDADLDGNLDGDDYFWIDSNVGNPSAFGFANGDFDYDGDIDGDDYFIIDSNIATAQGGSPFENSTSASGLSSVPEPSAALFFAVLTPLLRRRRRDLSMRSPI